MASAAKDKESWKKWQVSSRKIAEVLYCISDGDKRVLCTSENSYSSETSVWGKVACKLLGGKENTLRNRLLLYRFWTLKRKKVEEYFDQIKVKKKATKLQPDKGSEEWRSCFCEPFYKPMTQEDRLECRNCHRWLHTICVEDSISNYVEGVDDFICPICTGDIVLPPILDKTISEGSSQQESTSARSPQTTNTTPMEKPIDNEELLSLSSDDDVCNYQQVDTAVSSGGQRKQGKSQKVQPAIAAPSSHKTPSTSATPTAKLQSKSPFILNLSQFVKTAAALKSSGKSSQKKVLDENLITITSDDDFVSPQSTTSRGERFQRAPGKKKTKVVSYQCSRKLFTSTPKSSYKRTSSVLVGPKMFSSPVRKAASRDPKPSPTRSPWEILGERSSPLHRKSEVMNQTTRPSLGTSGCHQAVSHQDRDGEDAKHDDGGSSAVHTCNLASEFMPLDLDRISSDDLEFENSSASDGDDDDLFKPFIETGGVGVVHEAAAIHTRTDPVENGVDFSAMFQSATRDKERKDKRIGENDRHAASGQENRNDVPFQNNVVKDQLSKDNERGGSENEDSDKEVPVDTSNVSTKFNIFISQEQLAKIVKLNEDEKQGSRYFEVVGSHTVILSKKFDEKNKVCVLSFERKKIGNAWDLVNPILTAYSHCKSETCSAKWKFSIYWQHKPNAPVQVAVRMYTGNMLHYASKPTSRFYTGEYREEARQQLMSKMPAAVRLDACAKADMEAVRNGKHTTIKTVKTFQVIKSKMEKENDLHKDVVLDLLQRRKMLNSVFPDKVIPGYIREVQIFPARITLYSSLQMEVMKRLMEHGLLSLQLDATGGLIKPLGEPYDDRRLLLYTVIARFPFKGSSELAITEMITADNKHTSIYSWLYTYFQTFKNRHGIKADHYGVMKFEIDFSKSMLLSLVRLFVNEPLDVYLNMFWHYYASDEEPQNRLEVFPIHVCRFHILKAMRKKFMEVFGKKNPKNKKAIVDLYMQWANALVRCKDLHSFDRRVKDIGVISLFRYFSTPVITRIADLHKPTMRDTIPWSEFVYQLQPQGGPFWMRSAFGQYTHSVFSFCAEKGKDLPEDASSEDHQQNIYYSKEISDYLCTYMLPYYPLITHMVYDACDIEIKDDTNNALEGYFGLLKTNIYKQRRHQKISRFVRRQAEVVKGMCNAAVANLLKFSAVNTGAKKTSDVEDIQESDDDVSEDSNLTESDSDSTDNDIKEPCDGRKNAKQPPTANTRKHGAEAQRNHPDTGNEWKVLGVCPSSFKGRNHDAISPEKQEEVFKKSSSQRSQRSWTKDFEEFIPLLSYGGIYDNDIRLTHTCNIDTTLQCLLALSLQIPGVEDFLQSKSTLNQRNSGIAEAVTFARHRDFNSAKTVWIRDVMQTDPEVFHPTGNMLGTEFNHAMSFVADLFPVKRFHRCSNTNCPGFSDPALYADCNARSRRWENTTISCMLEWSPQEFEKTLNFVKPYDCPCFCGSGRIIQHQFDFEEVPFVMYPLMTTHRRSFDERNLPYTQQLGGIIYRVFAYTCLVGEMSGESQGDTGNDDVAHFIVKFIVDKKKIVYDGLQRRPYVEQVSPGHKVTSVWLVKN